MKKIILIVAIVTLTGFIFGSDIQQIFTGSTPEKKEKKKKKNKEEPSAAESNVKILEKWDLPAVLLEVSGIAFLDKDRFACVQDEKGVIYIFNTSTGKIEKEISFAGPGDFEGITLSNQSAYVVRADGLLFEVDMRSEKTNEYRTGLTMENNIEGLCFDIKNNRLLLTGKEPDLAYPGFKAIYAFDIATKTIAKEPVYKIDLSDELLRAGKSKKNKTLMPSAIAIHPLTDEIFIADGPAARLLQLDKDAKLVKVFSLGSQFPQAEGISFSPGGTIYISNEGKKVAANIIEVGLD